MVRAKMLGKKSSPKSAKNAFLYSQEYRNQKMGRKKRETIFPETHEWLKQICWEKYRRKNVRKNFFYIPTHIVTKKWGEKIAETIFPEPQEWCRQKCWEKIVAKKSGKTFFIFTRIS